MSFAASFPRESEERMRVLFARYIEDTAAREWPMMAHHTAKPKVTPMPLAQVLQLALSLRPENPGQETAQREIVSALDAALDARRARITSAYRRLTW